MNLHLHESILLLGLDDNKGHFRTNLTYLNYGYSTAVLMDLFLAERISLEENRLTVRTNALTHSKVLNEELDRIQKAKKPPKMNRWLHKMVQRNSKSIKKTIESLIQQGILKQIKKKVLWIFTVKRYPSVNLAPENHLRHRLRGIIFENLTPSPKEQMLLILIDACQLIKELIPEKEKRKEAKQKIKLLYPDNEMKDLLDKAIKEMQMAVTVAATSGA